MGTIRQAINEARKTNKNKWYTLRINQAGKTIEVKGYNTWLQILRIDGINNPSRMDISVKEFNDHLDQILA